ncbi:acetate/propionate family kinase [Saccharomonospora sp. NPDC006951]
MYVLVVNAGSSSLKVRLLDPSDEVVGKLDLGSWRGAHETEELSDFVAGLERVDAVGHRIVHGGTAFTEPVVIDEQVRKAIADLTELAPLHQPRGLAGIEAVAGVLPGKPAVACFDTAFHASLPGAAATYALPKAWNERWSLRRYGFHGLSHDYASRRAAELLGKQVGDLRLVTCHLGAGASLAAVGEGRSLDTTMGFTPLAGLVMATRTGSVDPGLVLWLQEHAGLGADQVGRVLEHESGLAGLSGGSGDMREVIEAADAGNPAATLAFDVYIHRLRREIAAMTAALDGIDALVFTGGVGEHSPRVRAAAAPGYLGVAIDERSNDEAMGDADITAAGAGVSTLVVTAREDLEIARHTRKTLTE